MLFFQEASDRKANNYTKRFSKPLAMRYHVIPAKMAIISNTDNNMFLVKMWRNWDP